MLPFYDVADRCSGHAKVFRNGRVRFAKADPAADLSRCVRRELGGLVRISAATRGKDLSPLGNLVSCVVEVRSKKEMRRPNARWVVAAVANKHVFWRRRAVPQLPSDPRGSLCDAINLDRSVSWSEAVRGPLPAPITNKHFFPKPLENGFSRKSSAPHLSTLAHGLR